MKLATLKEGGRDGTLVVVSCDLDRAVRVPDVAPTLQRAWRELDPDTVVAALERCLAKGGLSMPRRLETEPNLSNPDGSEDRERNSGTTAPLM